MYWKTICASLLFAVGVTPCAFAQPQSPHEPLARTVSVTSTQAFRYAPNSAGALAVREWLLERNAEGQLPNSADLFSNFDQAIISGKIITTTVSGTGLMPEDAIAPDGTTLPLHGTNGQTISITDCIPHTSKTTYNYVWDSLAPGGGTWRATTTDTHTGTDTACKVAGQA